MSWVSKLVRLFLSLFRRAGVGRSKEGSGETYFEKDVVVDIVPKEETPSATIRVSDYGIVLPQEIEVDIGQFTLYYDDGSKVYEWTDFGGLRPVRATIHYEYRIRGLGVEMSGYGSVENTEVAKAKVRLPYTTYPFFVETVPGDYAVQKRYYYGSRESPYVAFEVETTVKAVDVQGNPIHRGVEPEASVALRLVKQTKRYRVLVEPSPSMATQTISRQGKKPKFDDRPPAVEYKAAGRVVWPSLRNSKIRDDTESALFTRERVERDQERRLTGVASNKVIEIEVEKPVRAHVMVSYQPSGGEWKHVLNLVERTKGVYMDALEDEVEYVNVQVRVYPIDTIGVVALRGLRVEVHQSALVGYGYTTERLALVGEYDLPEAGFRVYLDHGDADKLPRLWSIRVKVLEEEEVEFRYAEVAHVVEDENVRVVGRLMMHAFGQSVPVKNGKVVGAAIDKDGVQAGRQKCFTQFDGVFELQLPKASLILLYSDGVYDRKDYMIFSAKSVVEHRIEL